MTATEQQEPRDPMQTSPIARTWRRFVPSIALSAFLMSLTVALINAAYAIRGAEIVVLKPDRLLVYRDATETGAVLVVALPTSMINAADSGHGDVLLDGTLTFGDGPMFAMQSVVTPVFSNDAGAAERCPVDTRCTRLPGLLVLEKMDTVADLPGGQARSRTLAFPLARWNCSGGAQDCARFDSEARAIAAGPKAMAVTVKLTFYDDGR